MDAGPLGGDWACGERVFGPPAGTLDADWLVPVVREAVPDASHASARAAVVRVWSVLREEADHRGCAPGDVADDVVGARLRGADGAAPGRVDEAALTVVRAAVRAYGAS